MEDTYTEATPVSWASLNLNTVVTERANGETQERTELPPGNYTFKFVGAKQNPYEPGTTDLDFVVAAGPHSKRHLFAKIPAPSVTKYAIQWAAILIKRLGVEQLPGEELIDTLNRAASNGASAVSGEVILDTWTDKNTGAMRSKPKLQFFSLQAAA